MQIKASKAAARTAIEAIRQHRRKSFGNGTGPIDHTASAGKRDGLGGPGMEAPSGSKSKINLLGIVKKLAAKRKNSKDVEPDEDDK